MDECCYIGKRVRVRLLFIREHGNEKNKKVICYGPRRRLLDIQHLFFSLYGGKCIQDELASVEP